jgi:hypothetical protein
MATLLERAAAVERLKAEFQGRALVPGRCDCAALVRSHLLWMGRAVPEIPRYSSFAGGFRALKKMGFADLAAMMDSLLPAIPPARMMIGDVGLLLAPSGRAEAMVVHAGPYVIGWHEGADVLVNITRPQFERAWSL